MKLPFHGSGQFSTAPVGGQPMPQQPIQQSQTVPRTAPRGSLAGSTPQHTMMPPSWEDNGVVSIQDVDDIQSHCSEEAARKRLTTYHLKRLEKMPQEYSPDPASLRWKRARTTIVTNISQQDVKNQIEELNFSQEGTVIQKLDYLCPDARRQVEIASEKFEELDPQRDQFCYHLVQLDNIIREMSTKERQLYYEDKDKARTRRPDKFNNRPKTKSSTKSMYKGSRSSHKIRYKERPKSPYKHKERRKMTRIGLNAYFARVPRDTVDAMRLLWDLDNKRRDHNTQYSMAASAQPARPAPGNQSGPHNSFQQTGGRILESQQQPRGYQGEQGPPRPPQDQQKQLPVSRNAPRPADAGLQQPGPIQTKQQSFAEGNMEGFPPPLMNGARGQPPQNNPPSKQQMIAPHPQGGQQQGPSQNAIKVIGPLPGRGATVNTNLGGNQVHNQQHHPDSPRSAANSLDSLQKNDYSDEEASSCSSFLDEQPHYSLKAQQGDNSRSGGNTTMLPQGHHQHPPRGQEQHKPSRHGEVHFQPPSRRAPARRGREFIPRITHVDISELKEEQRLLGKKEGECLRLMEQVQMLQADKRERQHEREYRARHDSDFDDDDRVYGSRRGVGARPHVISRPPPVEYRYVQTTPTAGVNAIVARTARMKLHRDNGDRDYGDYGDEEFRRGGDGRRRGQRVREMVYDWEAGSGYSDYTASTGDYLNDGRSPFRQKRGDREHSYERRSDGTSYHSASSASQTPRRETMYRPKNHNDDIARR